MSLGSANLALSTLRPRKLPWDRAARASRTRSILIVDDNLPLNSLITEILTKEGYRMEAAHTGAACLLHARATPPDLILLDIALPDIDGFMLAQRLGRDPLTRHIPVLFVSGVPELTPRFRALVLPNADFLAKPFSREGLIARVALSLRQFDAREDLLDDASRDSLTGLGNERHLQKHLRIEQARCARYGNSLALLIVDVDQLKRINADHGHLAGSQVLASVGDILLDETRETDVAARYGGDEFVVLLPHAQLLEGMYFAGRNLAKVRPALAAGNHFSVSIGVAAGVAGSELPHQPTIRARRLPSVYRAKHLGGISPARTIVRLTKSGR